MDTRVLFQLMLYHPTVIFSPVHLLAHEDTLSDIPLSSQL